MKKIIVSLMFLVAMSSVVLAAPADKAAGDVGYTAIGVQRWITFDVHEATAKQPAKGTLHYTDVNGIWYDVNVQVVDVVGNGAYFAGPVVAGSGVGSWLYAVVHDVGTPGSNGDTVAGNYMTETDARNAVSGHNEMPNTPYTPFLVTSGNLVVQGGGSEPGAPSTCTQIQSGTLVDSKGISIGLGYDQWGYNYQAHMFLGYFDNNARPATPVDSGDTLIMKWNDAWLSNGDCDGDGKLDRHYGFASYRGSGAWLTNHQWGTNTDGTTWDYFVKIVAVPTDALLMSDGWHTAGGSLIGYQIWGDFAVTQEVLNDPMAGAHGLLYKADFPGFGVW